jgi:DNA polymerase-3 subunit beta
MKIVAKRDVFAAALSAAANVVPLRSARPNLKNALLVGHGDGRLEVQATDMDVGLRYRLLAESVEDAGSLCIPCIPLSGLLRECSEEVVRLETEGAKGQLSVGRDEFEIVGQEASEFPEVPDFHEDDEAQALKIPAVDLKQMIDRTIFSAAKEPGRFAINGIFIAFQEKNLEMVATDSRRLALAKRKIKDKAKWHDEGVITPVKMMQEVRRLCEACNATEQIHLLIRDRTILVRGGNETLSSQLVEGTFPRYKQVVPADNDKEITFNREAMLAALRKAAFMAGEETRIVQLRFTSGTCDLESRSPDKGQARVKVEVEYDGPALAVGFNPQYLQDCLKVLAAEKVRLELKNESKPVVLREGKDFLYVLMPVNPNEE